MFTTAQLGRYSLSAAPRAHLFSRATRNVSTTPRHLKEAPAFTSFPQSTGPSPPRLPKGEQEIFETLQRQSTGAFSTPRSPPQINQSPDATSSEAAAAQSEISRRTENVSSGGTAAPPPEGARSAESKLKETYDRVIQARGKGEELHPNVRRGAPPEFEGERNPRTGEVGGPKTEPLRWGAAGEWSYNGRTTDF